MEIVSAPQRFNGSSMIRWKTQMVTSPAYRSPIISISRVPFLFPKSKVAAIQPSIRRRLRVSASLPIAQAGSSPVQVSASLFTFATVMVMPFYTLMILAPRKAWTKRMMESSLPHVILGAIYAYLLSISWTPNTLHYMFASKYYFPELAGITQMFSSTLTVASAWVHLLAADFFVGRQIYLEGLEQNVETRHSLLLCLMFCPIGMLSHFITKAITVASRLHKAEVGEITDKI